MARADFLLLSVAMVAQPVRKADETTALFAVSLRKSRRDSAGKLLSIIAFLVEWPSELIRRRLEQSGHAVQRWRIYASACSAALRDLCPPLSQPIMSGGMRNCA